MKKKTLISAAVAVMIVVSMAVTGLAAGVSVSGPSSIETGETITITVTGASEGTSGDVSTSGLEVTNASGGFSTASNVILLADAGGMTATYTCRVTAGAGETASFSVSNVIVSDGTADQAGDGDSWSATVAGSDEPSTEPSAEPTDEPSTEPSQAASSEPSGDTSAAASSSASSGAQSGTASKAPGSSTKPGTSGSADNMPKTGDATMDLWTLAIIASACAAVAIVAGKKVFSHK